ncbi:MAG: restriction endonuclease subunit S [Methylococcaceae bacterium]
MLRAENFNAKYPIKPLGEVVDFLDNLRKPIKASDRIGGEYPYYGANGLQGFINDFIFDEPLVLLAEDGGHFGNPEKTIAYIAEGKYWVNNHAHVLKPKDGLDLKFLCRVLENYDVSPFIKGATRAKLTKGDAFTIPIPFPSFAEQKRIAAILDKADRLHRKNQQAIQLSDQFLRSLFMDLFGDPVTNPKGWEVKPICKIAIVKTGNTPSRAESEYYGDYIEWIKSDNINTPHHILTTASEYLSKEGYEVGRKVSEGATLITCIAGSFNCIGNIAFADREVCFNQQINALIPMTVKPWFLYALILFSKKKIQAASTNAMKGMVSKGVLEKIEVICPPEDLQIKFEKIFENQREIMVQTEKSRQLADNAFFALSQKAFAGEL